MTPPSTPTTGARPLYAFFGHHKCATGWIDSVLRETCFHLGWRFRIVAQEREIAPHGSLGRLVADERVDLLAYINADADHARTLPAHRGFHVVRDPRDVIVSGYFSHLHSHQTRDWPELVPYRERLQRASKAEGLMLEMEFSRQFLEPMMRWDYDQPHVLELRLEDFSREPEAAFRRIYEHLGFLHGADPSGLAALARRAAMRVNILNQRGRRFTPFHLPVSPFRFPLDGLGPRRLSRILEKKSFKKLSGGRKHGQENVRSHYRKGKHGDWINHFEPEHVQRFKELYNGLLLKLGYETDEHWDRTLIADAS